MDERFDGGKEMHSTVGVVLFSYGMLGTFLFSVFLWQVIAAAGVRNLAYALPALIFGLAHNGLRQPIFYMLLALIVTVHDTDKQRAPQ